ncbi:unnamed protein product [Diamesa serratosioi]
MASIKIPEQKIILCGEFGVGKSSIFRRKKMSSLLILIFHSNLLGLDHFSKNFQVNDKEIALTCWDTGGMERIASVTTSYYKFAEAAILVFALDNPASFHSLSQHLLDIVTYAENAKIFLCGNRMDLEHQVTDIEMKQFCEQCHSLVQCSYKTSCKTGEGLDDMFNDIAKQLVDTNRSRIELQALEQHGFKVHPPDDEAEQACLC